MTLSKILCLLCWITSQEIRYRLKVIDDNMVSAEETSYDRFGKVRPFLNRVHR